MITILKSNEFLPQIFIKLQEIEIYITHHNILLNIILPTQNLNA